MVQVGQHGLSDAVIKKVREELDHHELIKVKVGQGIFDSVKAAGEELAERSGSHLAQVLGRTVLLYRMRKHEPEIRLPNPGSR